MKSDTASEIGDKACENNLETIGNNVKAVAACTAKPKAYFRPLPEARPNANPMIAPITEFSPNTPIFSFNVSASNSLFKNGIFFNNSSIGCKITAIKVIK